MSMVNQRLLMRRIREILRLKFESGWSHRVIAQVCSVGVGTVSDYVHRAVRAGLTWPLPADLDDAALEARLFEGEAVEAGVRSAPDWGYVHQELKRPGVTRHLLWLEYFEAHPQGYRYSQFCEHYRRFVTRRCRRRCASVTARGRRYLRIFRASGPIWWIARLRS